MLVERNFYNIPPIFNLRVILHWGGFFFVYIRKRNISLIGCCIFETANLTTTRFRARSVNASCNTRTYNSVLFFVFELRIKVSICWVHIKRNTVRTEDILCRGWLFVVFFAFLIFVDVARYCSRFKIVKLSFVRDRLYNIIKA